MSEQLSQADLFEVMMANSTNGQLRLVGITSSTEVSSNILGDHKGNLYGCPFMADTVEIELRLTMKRKVFLEINELLSKVVRS
jgi:hypothetical protein